MSITKRKTEVFIKAHIVGIATAVGSGLLAIFAIIALMMVLVITENDSTGCNSGGSNDNIQLTGKDNAAKIFNFLVSKEHFTDASAAGAVGRAQVESTFSPTIVNHGSGTTGIFQWGTGGANPDRLDHGGFIKIGDKSTYTLSNELKLTDYELHHGYSEVLSKMKHESDVDSAAEYWTDVYEGAPGQAEGQTETDAKQIYAKLGHGNSGASSDADSTADSGGSSSSCGSSDDTDASDIKIAEKYLGLPYHLGGDSNPIAEGKSKSEVNATDCNKFVWAVLKQGHYAVPSTMPGNCDDSIQRLHKYEVPESKAKAGTVLITHDHAMIMMTPWRGVNGTKIINEGGGENDVNKGHTYEYCMASVLNDKRYYFNVPKK